MLQKIVILIAGSAVNVMTLQDKIEHALNTSATLPQSVYDTQGLTSPKSQGFLNLISKDMKVLEIGTFCGGSTVAIAESARSVVTVDNWEQIEVLSVDKTLRNYVSNPRKEFLKNTKNYNNISLIDGDVFSIEVFKALQIQEFDVIFYDGSHSTEDIFKFMLLYECMLQNTILIIDDYNFESVKTGIEIGLQNLKLKVKNKWLIDTGKESKDDFWNGISIFIFE
jgi:precorrin-6B methylase 2